jgi:hypothetical protein
MKHLFRFVMVLLLLASACGGGGEEAADNAQDSTDTSSDQTIEVQEQEPPPPPAYPEGTLDPASVTADVAVSAQALNEAYFAWDGKTVTLQGYPDVMYGDSMVIEDEVELVAAPGADEELASVTFAELQDRPVCTGDMITVRGTVDYYWTGELQLIDGEMVTDAPEADPDVIISPYAYDGLAPVEVSDFHDVFSSWMNREVTVEGYYHSTTTSTTDYGVTVRVDLAEPGDVYTKYVACEMTGEIPAESNSLMVADREGVMIRGTITGESFGMVGLENCVLLNR